MYLWFSKRKAPQADEAFLKLMQRVMPRLIASAVKHIAVKSTHQQHPMALWWLTQHSLVQKLFVYYSLCAITTWKSEQRSPPFFCRCFECFWIWRHGVIVLLNSSNMVLFFPQYVSLSLRPLTCEVKLGHRWGPQEQGCMHHHPKISNRRRTFVFQHVF